MNQIIELLEENGWTGLIVVEQISAPEDESPEVVEVRLADNHSTAPGDLVNVYTDGIHPLEQVQQECLRSLRTGRPGL